MVRFYITEFGRHCSSFNQRQQVSLHSLSRNSFPQIIHRPIRNSQLINLIQKHNSIFFYHFNSLSLDIQIGQVAFESFIISTKEESTEFLNRACDSPTDEIRLLDIKIGLIAGHNGDDMVIIVAFLQITEFFLPQLSR